jgi:hypothetical protein
MTEHTDDTAPAEEEHPKGALSLMLFYLLVIIGVWIYTYSILLSRS